jgi:hypothetical protein
MYVDVWMSLTLESSKISSEKKYLPVKTGNMATKIFVALYSRTSQHYSDVKRGASLNSGH